MQRIVGTRDVAPEIVHPKWSLQKTKVCSKLLETPQSHPMGEVD